ncbi:unnamed protein product, partial [Ectocarpus fasciculatus]
TRSALGTAWNACERRSVHTWGRLVGKPHARRSREGLAKPLRQLWSTYDTGVRTRWKKLGATAVTADGMKETGGKYAWANCVTCNVAPLIWLTSTAAAHGVEPFLQISVVVGDDDPSRVLFCSDTLFYAALFLRCTGRDISL